MPFVARCPKCSTELDVGDDLASGQSVECPVCLTRFVPDWPPGNRPPAPRTASGRRDRDDDADVEEDYDRPRRRRRYAPEPLTQEEAAATVAGPALWLQVTGWVGAALSLLGGAGFAAFMMFAMANNPANNPNQGEAVVWTILSVLYAVFGTLYFAAIAFGAAKMKRLESWGWAMTAAVLGILTILLCGICFPPTWAGFGCGIWAVVVLSKAEVKAAFPTGDDEDYG